MNQSTDAELVARANAGDGRAFAGLVRRHQDYAYGTAVGLLSDFELARDVVQEAFLCAYRDLRKLKDPERFGGWLRGIVRHTALHALRELQRIRKLTEEFGRNADHADSSPTADRHLECEERRAKVRAALERLTEKNREAVSLFYVDGLSYEEIAQFLDVSKTTVLGRLQRGRAQLRKELTMVEEVFNEQRLPEDFSAEVERLLNAMAARTASRDGVVGRLAEIGVPAVGALCDALGDSRSAVRVAAARALCLIADERALRPVLRLLYADDAWFYWSAFDTGDVLRIPGMRDALLQVIAEGDKGLQSMAIYALGHAKHDDEVYNVVERIFRKADTNRRTAVAAMQALCTIRPESAADIVTEALKGPDLYLRGRAARYAAELGLLPPIDACVKAFSSGVGPCDRIRAGELVLRHGGRGKEMLKQLMAEGSPGEQSTAAMVLALSGHEEAFARLRQSLVGRHENRAWVKMAMYALRGHYGEEVTSWLQADGLHFPELHPAVWSHVRTIPPDLIPAFERLYKDGTPASRAGAVRVLTHQQGAAFLPELRRCLRAGKPGKVAREAFRQMCRLGDAAMPTVEQMLESDCWAERKSALCLLRRWGKLASKQLEQARGDPHVAVRAASKTAASPASS
ncbi:MAG TPA: RNA polymerase sigma factor [Candidatus Hydrogenedentes bacterium]|nr:RNA polymerase sigma factor [Candidatus Hydrogenedentota bacterium]